MQRCASLNLPTVFRLFLEALGRTGKNAAIPDIAVIIPTPTSQYEDALTMLVSHSIPCAVVVESAVEAQQIADTLYNTGLISIIAGTTEEVLFDRLSYGLQLQQKNQSLLRQRILFVELKWSNR